jgi:hypothetical protein
MWMGQNSTPSDLELQFKKRKKIGEIWQGPEARSHRKLDQIGIRCLWGSQKKRGKTA